MAILIEFRVALISQIFHNLAHFIHSSDSLSDTASFPPIGQNTYLPHPYNQNRASACPNPNRRDIRHLHIKYVFHTTTEPFFYQFILLPYNTLSLLIIIKVHHLSFSQDQAEPTLPILIQSDSDTRQLPPVSVVSPVRCSFSYPLKNETLIPTFRQPAQSESSWSLKSASDLPSTTPPAFWKERSLPR